MLILSSLDMLKKKKKTQSTPNVKLEELDIDAAPTAMAPANRDVVFVEKLHEQLQKQMIKL